MASEDAQGGDPQVSVDQEGRVTVNVPGLADRLNRADPSDVTADAFNLICTHTNTVAHCGALTEEE